MKIEIKQMNNGIQHINRIYFTGDDGSVVDVDLWDDELRELKEQIEQHFPEQEA